MKNKTKAIIFLPLAFLALGIISLAGKCFNSNQKTNPLIETAQADVPTWNFNLVIGVNIGGGCFAAGACGSGCCCGCCCGC